MPTDKNEEENIINNSDENYHKAKNRYNNVQKPYDDIKYDDANIHLTNSKINIKSFKLDNIVFNSIFILFTFTIFPLTLAFLFDNYFPLLIMGVIALILVGISYYLLITQRFNSIRDLKRIYYLYGIYFIFFGLILIIWFILNPFEPSPLFANYLILLTLFFITIYFFQNFIGNVSKEISDPITTISWGPLGIYGYYSAVFICLIILIFAIALWMLGIFPIFPIIPFN